MLIFAKECAFLQPHKPKECLHEPCQAPAVKGAAQGGATALRRPSTLLKRRALRVARNSRNLANHHTESNGTSMRGTEVLFSHGTDLTNQIDSDTNRDGINIYSQESYIVLTSTCIIHSLTRPLESGTCGSTFSPTQVWTWIQFVGRDVGDHEAHLFILQVNWIWYGCKVRACEAGPGTNWANQENDSVHSRIQRGDWNSGSQTTTRSEAAGLKTWSNPPVMWRHVRYQHCFSSLQYSSVSMPLPACRWAQEEISNPRLVPPERCSPSVETLCERGWSWLIFSNLLWQSLKQVEPPNPTPGFYCRTSREMQEKKLHSVLRLVLLC